MNELSPADWRLILIPLEIKMRSDVELEVARVRIADYLSTALMNPDALDSHIQECSRASRALRSTPEIADIDNLALVAEKGLEILDLRQLCWLCFSVISLNALVECLWREPLSLAWEQPLAQAYPEATLGSSMPSELLDPSPIEVVAASTDTSRGIDETKTWAIEIDGETFSVVKEGGLPDLRLYGPVPKAAIALRVGNRDYAISKPRHEDGYVIQRMDEVVARRLADAELSFVVR